MFSRKDFDTEAEYLEALRDWFAGQALKAGLTGATLPTKADRDRLLPILCPVCYEIADAMLEARK